MHITMWLAYACEYICSLKKDSDLLQLIIYGVSGVVIPDGFVDFNDTLDHYLEVLLRPGGAEIPAQLILDAVAAGQIDVVAAAFDQAVQLGYASQLIPVLEQVATLTSQKTLQILTSCDCHSHCHAIKPECQVSSNCIW